MSAALPRFDKPCFETICSAFRLNRRFDRIEKKEGRDVAVKTLSDFGKTEEQKEYRFFSLNGMMEEVDKSGNFINV